MSETRSEEPAGPGSLQPGTKGTPGVDENDSENKIPTPEPGTEPMHDGGP